MGKNPFEGTLKIEEKEDENLKEEEKIAVEIEMMPI